MKSVNTIIGKKIEKQGEGQSLILMPRNSHNECIWNENCEIERKFSSLGAE